MGELISFETGKVISEDNRQPILKRVANGISSKLSLVERTNKQDTEEIAKGTIDAYVALIELRREFAKPNSDIEEEEIRLLERNALDGMGALDPAAQGRVWNKVVELTELSKKEQ